MKVVHKTRVKMINDRIANGNLRNVHGTLIMKEEIDLLNNLKYWRMLKIWA